MWIAALFGILLAAGGEEAVPDPLRLELVEGQPFPDYPLPSLDDGKPLSISSFRGRKLVLHVFASW